jgi:predicted DNA-binding WGR domain protein
MAKLAKSTLPSGHSREDFQCFGPPASKDGAFDGTNLCDMGCFNQGEAGDDEAVDSNKYYHAAVVQSKKDSKWYLYVEYGRVGVTNPQFQFTECSSQAEAQKVYIDQCRSKNDKRGEWYQHPVLGKLLRPKKGKDCYLVRPQTTRSTGLPDARTITSGTTPKTVAIVGSAAKSFQFDSESSKLLADLNVGTINYTRSNMIGSALPTQEAIDEGRLICSHAQEVVNKGGNEKELKELTKLLYSRIPKVKSRTDTDWVLDANKISTWLMDLDAYEAAVTAYNQGSTTQVNQISLPFTLNHIDESNKLYDFITKFFLNATSGRHNYSTNKIKIKNVFEIDRKRQDFINHLKNFGIVRANDHPLYQPSERKDIDNNTAKLYSDTKSYMLFHGSRTCNISGILRESFRLPKTLSNVAISGWMFGTGVYLADQYTKSLGYTSYSGSYWAGGAGTIQGRGAFIFICDAMIGNPYIAPRSQCFSSPPNGYHSVFGKANVSGVVNNEFVVFDTKFINIRYLVELV